MTISGVFLAENNQNNCTNKKATWEEPVRSTLAQNIGQQ